MSCSEQRDSAAMSPSGVVGMLLMCGALASASCTSGATQTDLKSCSLGQESRVTCHVILRDESGEDESPAREVYLNVTFRLLDVGDTDAPSSSDTVRRCIGLSQTRVRLGWITANLSQIPDLGAMTRESSVDLAFDQEHPSPVGEIELERSCLNPWKPDPSCIRNVTYSAAPKWDEIHGLLDFLRESYLVSLGAQLVRAQIDFNPTFVSKAQLSGVAKLLGNHTLTREVRLSHGDWPTVEGAPWNMPALTRLELPWDRIAHVDSEWLRSLKNLTYLSLAHNNLKTVPQGIQFLVNLKYLDLSFNPITYHETTVYDVLKGFEGLNLFLASTQMNTLQALQPLNTTKPLVSLVALDVSLCNISITPEEHNILANQVDLEMLNLSYNELSSIPSNFLKGLCKLRVLDLSHNKLNTSLNLNLEDNVLQELDLSWNTLENPGNIISTGVVRWLNLSRNRISEWSNPNIFLKSNGRHAWAQHLDLSYNVISAFEMEMLVALSVLDSIDLGGNIFDCNDCRTPNLQTFLSTSLTVLNLGSNAGLVCFNPEGVHGQSHLVSKFEIPAEKCSGSRRGDTVYFVIGMILATATALVSVVMLALLICYVRRYDISYSIHLLHVKERWKAKNPGKGFLYDAFISYSHEDRHWVQDRLVPGVEETPYGFKVGLRDRDLILGSLIAEGTIDLVYSSKNTIMVLSYAYINSQWCRWEMEHVKRARHSLVLLEMERLDRRKVPREIKYLMDTRTYVPWQEGQEEPWLRVADALAGKSIPTPGRVNLWLWWWGRGWKTDPKLDTVQAETTGEGGDNTATTAF